MTGTGTSTDPYIPVTRNEFITATGTDGAYVSLPEGGGVFDMNEIAPEGNLTIDIYCKVLDSNGWTIANAYNVRYHGTGIETVTNMNFLDFYSEVTDNIFFRLSFTNCKMSGIITADRVIFYTGTLNRCSLNIKYLDQADSLGASFKFCKLILDQSEVARSDLNLRPSCTNCFVEYRAKEGAQNNSKMSGSSSVWHSNAGNFITTPSGTKVSVTEEQLRDAAYLRSIGFPIAGD